MSVLICDRGCKEEFEMAVQTETVADDIERVFLKCPHCGEKYTSYYTNTYVKVLQDRITAILVMLSGKKMTKGLEKEIKKVKGNLSKEMNRIKQVVENAKN